MLAPMPVWDPGLKEGRDRATARRLAWLLGFCLPLSSGLTLGMWLPGFPDQVTVIRVVTFGALVWLIGHPLGIPLPTAPRRMLQYFSLVLGYAAVTLLWAPDRGAGLHHLVTLGMALMTAVAVLLLVRGDGPALRSFALGVLVSGGLQVAVAVGEIETGRHLSHYFDADYVARWGLASIEQVIGATAWGSMGNPNDLGGYWLMVTAVFLSRGAYGVDLRGFERALGWGILAISVFVGLTALADARAYRLGIGVLVAMRIVDWVAPPGRCPLRAPLAWLAIMAGVAVAVLDSASIFDSIRSGSADALRLDLAAEGFSTALLTGGFGRGIGTEQALIDSGGISTNFHNIVAQLAAELGFAVAAAFLVYLSALIINWAFATRSARRLGREAACAQASLAFALLIYGVTSSGVLESPTYWGFFAVTALLAAQRRQPDKALETHSRVGSSRAFESQIGA